MSRGRWSDVRRKDKASEKQLQWEQRKTVPSFKRKRKGGDWKKKQRGQTGGRYSGTGGKRQPKPQGRKKTGNKKNFGSRHQRRNRKHQTS